MINIRDLNFNYSNQQNLFHHLQLDLKPGSITGLLGKNGAGKTTLLKLLIGLLHPQQGNIEAMGLKPQLRQPDFLEQTYFVPEEFYLSSLSVKDYIRAYRGFYPNFDLQLMDRILEDFRLSPTAGIHKMSYGQRKKFLISFALATRCRFLVLDEPTNGLDIPSKSIFRKVVAGALDENQLVVISTHQVKDVENLLDQIIILDEGEVIFQEETLHIADTYQFGYATSLENGSIMFSEPAPGGYKVIKPAQKMMETEIDIELLFNAVTSGKLKLKKHENTEAI
ncbi:MAG: ATP-binding cassette domain-containing protein [Candidatus Cyclobacteriaceae bacterium M3_2C_046]